MKKSKEIKKTTYEQLERAHLYIPSLDSILERVQDQSITREQAEQEIMKMILQRFDMQPVISIKYVPVKRER